MEKMDTTLYWL